MEEKVTKSKALVSSLLLTIAAFIWGTAFVAQSKGLEEIGNFTKIRQRDLSLAKQVAGDGLLRNIHFSGEFRDAHFPH